MSQPKTVAEFKRDELCYNGLLPFRGKYLYSSRSGQLWRSEFPPDCPNVIQGLPWESLIAVWNLSPNKDRYSPKNLAARESSRLPQEFKGKGMVYVIYKGKHYWQHKDDLYRIKWTRASRTEYLMARNFSNA
jgi:hypothetical protein